MKQLFLTVIACLPTLLPCSAQWQPQAVGTDASFRAVSAAGPDVVWIGGTKGTFVRTTDGGQTWQTGTVPDAQTCDFRDVQAIDAQTAYLMSAGPAEKARHDSIKRQMAVRTGRFFTRHNKRVCFSIAWISGIKNTASLLATQLTAGGLYSAPTMEEKTWQPIPPTSLPLMEPNEAAFAASGTSLVVQGKRNVWIASGGGMFGRVFRSRDRGQTWAVSATPLPGGEATGLFGMQFFNDKIGIVVGGNYKQEQKSGPNAAITRDGGQTWTLLTPTDPPGLKEAIALLPGDRLLAAGPSGTSLSADQGQTWQRLDTEGFHAMVCVKGTCYAVGAKGKVSKQVFK